MSRGAVIVDTNVVVAGLLTGPAAALAANEKKIVDELTEILQLSERLRAVLSSD